MIKTPLSTVIGGAFWTPGATVIGGNTPTFDQQIQRLFANGEQGFYQDPYDLGVMYQDSTGTTAVNASGQPLGLMLDKSKGLTYGEELLTDGNFENNLVGSISDGSGSVSTWELNTNAPISGNRDAKLTVTTPGPFRPLLAFPSGLKEIGAVYEFSFDYKIITGSPSITLIGMGAVITTNVPLVGSGKFVAQCVCTGTSTNATAYFGSSSAYSLQIDNVSVRRVLGNHAYQTTSAARPILRDAPRRIDFDAVDDKLITNLPAQLTGCTVVRSVPNVGTQILTGQTIPATYEDNKDHCGLIVINRALTPSETSAITAELNKRAGG